MRPLHWNCGLLLQVAPAWKYIYSLKKQFILHKALSWGNALRWLIIVLYTLGGIASSMWDWPESFGRSGKVPVLTSKSIFMWAPVWSFKHNGWTFTSLWSRLRGRDGIASGWCLSSCPDQRKVKPMTMCHIHHCRGFEYSSSHWSFVCGTGIVACSNLVITFYLTNTGKTRKTIVAVSTLRNCTILTEAQTLCGV